MAAESRNTAVEECKKCIDMQKSFVLHGGAGSGKTQSLKELLVYLKQSNSKAKVMCITHTNVAVEEILSRTGNAFPVSTIHSFVNSLIKDYKINIYTIIGKLFYIHQVMVEEKVGDISEKEYSKNVYKQYKSAYEKYADKLYQLTRQQSGKVPGKKDFDNNAEEYINSLNIEIESINQKIDEEIASKDYSKIKYNETSFDSLKELSYGHDGLLSIFHLLIQKYPLLSKMIADKYDYLFVDEYQDTNADVLYDFISLSRNSGLTLCLFGDSMQSIYSDGIGNVDKYIGEDMISIPKPDNYRCAYEIINFVNPIRMDGLEQHVALKKDINGKEESEESRHGFVKFLFSVCEKKPNLHSSFEERENYQKTIDILIEKAKEYCPSAKVLMLTNKAIAEKNHFQNLYRVFNDRYYDVRDRMEKYLTTIQVLELCDICNAYLHGEYNLLINSIRSNGFVIHKLSDKKDIKDAVISIIENDELSMWDAIELANEKHLIRLSETCNNQVEIEKAFVKNCEEDSFYLEFKNAYETGNNTYNRIKESINIGSAEQFEEMEALYKRERFVKRLFSSEIKFSEAFHYSKYLAEETEYITMHKTKGSSIENVIVVLDEFNWNDYNFTSLYLPENEDNSLRLDNSKKLVYVACSRAISGLVCIRVITPDEVGSFKKVFPIAEQI